MMHEWALPYNLYISPQETNHITYKHINSLRILNAKLGKRRSIANSVATEPRKCSTNYQITWIRTLKRHWMANNFPFDLHNIHKQVASQNNLMKNYSTQNFARLHRSDFKKSNISRKEDWNTTHFNFIPLLLTPKLPFFFLESISFVLLFEQLIYMDVCVCS